MQLTALNDPILHKVSRKTPEKLRTKLMAALHKTYYDRPFGICAGMAGVQIGFPYNAFVAQGQLFINTKGVKGIGDTYEAKEGCFSTRGYHSVRRYHEIEVTDEDGGVTTYTGYMAEVIQHEYDHVRGKLISDRKD